MTIAKVLVLCLPEPDTKSEPLRTIPFGTTDRVLRLNNELVDRSTIMQVLTSITILSSVALVVVSAATYDELRSIYTKFVDETVPPEKQQKFKDGFAKMKDCISPLINKIDFNILESITAGVTKAGVECGKNVQDMDESQKQAQFMPCVRQELQTLMNQRNDADRAMLMEAKGCAMNLLKSSSSP